MNATATRADRYRSVRSAARGWRRGGLIDEATLAVVEGAYPDDRRRLGPVFRVLAFFFTALAVVAAFVFVMLVVKPHDSGAAVLALLFGAALWAATEGLKGPLRLADAGIESATALAGAAYMAFGVAYLSYELADLDLLPAVRVAWLSAVLLFGVTAVRWGSAVGAALATACLGLLLLWLPGARLTWVLAALLLAPLALYGSESARLTPSHRRACAAVLLLALVGLYVALHIGSWDGQLIEREMGGHYRDASAPLPLARALFIWATALVPLALLAFAIATRRRLLLGAGLVLGAVSLITLRFYLHIAPLWVILCAAGGGLILSALALRRWLESGAGHERGGWTAHLILGESAKGRVAEAVVAIAAATPQPAAAEAPRFEGGGGRSGGAGAGGSF